MSHLLDRHPEDSLAPLRHDLGLPLGEAFYGPYLHAESGVEVRAQDVVLNLCCFRQKVDELLARLEHASPTTSGRQSSCAASHLIHRGVFSDAALPNLPAAFWQQWTVLTCANAEFYNYCPWG